MWLAAIGVFVLLGILASPARLGEALLPALVVGVGLTLIARPVSVLLCATPFGMPLREQVYGWLLSPGHEQRWTRPAADGLVRIQRQTPGELFAEDFVVI